MISMIANAGMYHKLALASLLGFALSACGGGSAGSSNATGYTAFANTTAVSETALRFLGTTNAGVRSAGNGGALDHDQNVINGGRLDGDFNTDRTQIDLNGGGVATLTNPANTEYLRVFSIEGSGTPVFGVVGQPTASADIPASGSTSYAGRIELVVADGNTVEALNGDADISASWSGAGSVDSLFSGFRQSGSGGAVPGSVSIENAAISGTGFSGGSVTTTGSLFTVTSNADISGTAGQFYGPGADEVGGILVLDDTQAGSLLAVGVYTAD